MYNNVQKSFFDDNNRNRQSYTLCIALKYLQYTDFTIYQFKMLINARGAVKLRKWYLEVPNFE